MNINNTLIIFFENNYPNEHKQDIINFLKEKQFNIKIEKAQKLIKKLIKPHGKDELYEHIVELYEVEDATMSLTGKRDHVIHAVNTFLLGVFINNYYLDNEVDMFQWKITALFHDIAYPLEISQQIIERYFKKMNAIKGDLSTQTNYPTFVLVPKNLETLENNKNSFDYIQNCIEKTWDLDVNVKKRYDDMICCNQICHGIISALTVLYLIDSMYQKKNPERDNDQNRNGWKQKYFENDVVPACSAIYLHNLKRNDFFNAIKQKAPLPYLLKLCDELQNWDRSTSNNQTGDFPENYDICIENHKIDFKVKYEDVKTAISQKINCLNDSNICVIKVL